MAVTIQAADEPFTGIEDADDHMSGGEPRSAQRSDHQRRAQMLTGIINCQLSEHHTHPEGSEHLDKLIHLPLHQNFSVFHGSQVVSRELAHGP